MVHLIYSVRDTSFLDTVFGKPVINFVFRAF